MLFDIDFDIKGESVNATAPIIKVLGVGGGGSNAVNHMVRMGIENVEFVICNTDIQALRNSPVKNRIQIGKRSTEGLGAGCHPERGREALDENLDDIRALLESNTKVLFITAGMGGGTGTGAAPKIAEIARELNILTIGIVSVPFSFEGEDKVQQAMDGTDELEKHVDALAIIINDRLLDDEHPIKLSEAFARADNVLAMAAKSIAEIIMCRGYINVDLEDVSSVMRNSGIALIGSGDGEGEERALEAVKAALYSPLLRDHDIRGASNVIVYIQCGNSEFMIDEQNRIMDYILRQVGQLTDIIWGFAQNPSLGDTLRVQVIATGFNRSNNREGRADGPHVIKLRERDEIQRGDSTLHRAEERPDFYTRERGDDLQMRVESAQQLEDEARRRREEQAQREERRRAQQPRPKRVEESHPEERHRNIFNWIEEKLSGGNGEDFKM